LFLVQLPSILPIYNQHPSGKGGKAGRGTGSSSRPQDAHASSMQPNEAASSSAAGVQGNGVLPGGGGQQGQDQLHAGAGEVKGGILVAYEVGWLGKQIASLCSCA
jgi:hypothetical protein